MVGESARYEELSIETACNGEVASGCQALPFDNCRHQQEEESADEATESGIIGPTGKVVRTQPRHRRKYYFMHRTLVFEQYSLFQRQIPILYNSLLSHRFIWKCLEHKIWRESDLT